MWNVTFYLNHIDLMPRIQVLVFHMYIIYVRYTSENTARFFARYGTALLNCF